MHQIALRSNLTKNQLLIWLGQKVQPDLPIYNIGITFTISWEIYPKHFQKAFKTLVNSSDALRTVIQEVDGVPQQRVVENFSYTTECQDFSQALEPYADIQSLVHKRCRVPFDLQKCLFDSVLIKISDKIFLWYLSYHHIISDGWSAWVIFRRMSEFYERSIKGRLEEKVKLPIFQDYIDYERGHQGSSRYLEAEAYWKQKLAENPEPISFYGKKPRNHSARAQRVTCNLGFERTQKLRANAVTARVSLFHIFAALLYVYVYRISGNRHLSLGTPFHNRRSEAFKDTIGLFIEVFPLRIVIEESDNFLSLIKKLKVQTFETLRHSQYAFGNPIYKKAYDIFLDYQTVSESNFYGAPIVVKGVYSGYENVSLALHVHDFTSSGNLTLDFDFRCDVFDEGHRHRAIQHFLQALDAFLEDSSQLIYRFNLLSVAERKRVSVEFNQTEVAFPKNQTILQLLEAQVQRTPNHTAVVFKNSSLTYAQLNVKANQLAHYLQALGVRPEVLVGICVERSLEMVVGLLGVLKAGGAYVPLDPAYPQERLACMLSESQAPVLLTQEKLVAQLPRHGAHAVCLDTDWEAIQTESEENLVSRVTPGNLAYVIYTSGSTGAPKGVMIQHQSLVNFTETAIVEYELTERDRVLQFASISFDTAAEEIYPCLTCGGMLMLRTDEMLSSVPTFLQKCQDLELTVLDLPTAYWHQVASELAKADLMLPTRLRLVIIGGEQALPERVGMWQKHVGTCPQLVNTYGPTEATVVATICKLSGSASADTTLQDLPIGRAIRNVQVYVLDQYLQPVPIGVPGELHIGGIGLARGYLNRPDLTAEKFIPNPFSNESQTRLYKTGDLARYLPDGNIEFLGRLDYQVKIRGFRIELGEIEAVLAQHPQVQEVVVIAQEDASGDKRLVVYVVLNQESIPATSALRDFLKEKLPEYMVPSTFVLLEALPLTSNGKVDRRALPALAQVLPKLESGFVAPRTPMEEMLAGIWAEVLGLEQIGIHDNFFELGGHSLQAMQLISYVHNTFSLDLPLRSLFEEPTVAGLTKCIERSRWVAQEMQAPSSKTASDREEGEL